MKKGPPKWAFCIQFGLMQSHGLGHEVESDGEVVVNEVVAEVFKERTRSVFDVEFSAVEDRRTFNGVGISGVGHFRVKRHTLGDPANGEIAC